MYEGFTPLGNPVNQKLHAQFQADSLDRQTQGMPSWKDYDEWYNEVMKPVTPQQTPSAPTAPNAIMSPMGLRGKSLLR